MWALVILATQYLKKGLFIISEVTKIENFEKAGKFYFYGSILFPTFIGFLILMLIGKIFEILAFLDLD